MRWQNWGLSLVLPTLFFPGVTLATPGKIPNPLAKEIISFTLFNYDNLIADHYEKGDLYAKQLRHLLAKGTGCEAAIINTILGSPTLNHEANPVVYMLIINKQTKDLCGYYFLDE